MSPLPNLGAPPSNTLTNLRRHRPNCTQPKLISSTVHLPHWANHHCQIWRPTYNATAPANLSCDAFTSPRKSPLSDIVIDLRWPPPPSCAQCQSISPATYSARRTNHLRQIRSSLHRIDVAAARYGCPSTDLTKVAATISPSPSEASSPAATNPHPNHHSYSSS